MADVDTTIANAQAYAANALTAALPPTLMVEP